MFVDKEQKLMPEQEEARKPDLFQRKNNLNIMENIVNHG